jgi:serine protease inhibitor
VGNYIAFNRPFLFLIAERSTGTVLFLGRVGNPAEE